MIVVSVVPSHALSDHFKIHVAAVNHDMPHGSGVQIDGLHNDHNILAKDFFRHGFFRCLPKRLAEFWGIYRIEPDFDLRVIVAKARDRVAAMNASDAQMRLFGFFVALGESRRNAWWYSFDCDGRRV